MVTNITLYPQAVRGLYLSHQLGSSWYTADNGNHKQKDHIAPMKPEDSSEPTPQPAISNETTVPTPFDFTADVTAAVPGNIITPSQTTEPTPSTTTLPASLPTDTPEPSVASDVGPQASAAQNNSLTVSGPDVVPGLTQAASTSPTVTPTTTTSPSIAAAAPQPPSDGTQAADSAETPAVPAVVVAATPTTPPPKKPHKKLVVFSAVGAVLLLAITAGVVFGLYLPNTPASVWKTGINRTGTALNTVIATATEPSKLESYKSSEISGTADATYDAQHFSGTFSSKFDQNTSDSGLAVAFKNSSGKTEQVTAKLLTNRGKTSTYPDIYLQLTGMKALGLDSFIPGISSYDGKWIMFDSQYLESIGIVYFGGKDASQKQVTSVDIAAAIKTATDVTNEYLLTTNSEKAVLTKDSFVGKETVDSVKTYHYRVGIDQAHATQYCIALGTAMYDTEAYKKLSGSDDAEIAAAKKKLDDSCKEGVTSELKSNDTYDLWIDSSHKLVYKVRITDTKGSYGEIGQRYNGDDNLTLLFASHDAERKSDSAATITTNLHTNQTTGTYTDKSTGSSPYNITVKVQVKALTENVKFTKPSSVTPIQEIMSKLNGIFMNI